MKTNNPKSKMSLRFLSVGFSIPLFLLAGCASQYDCYPCGRVSCHYCPPKPLQSSNDPSCDCKDSIGQAYLGKTTSQKYVQVAPGFSGIVQADRPHFEGTGKKINVLRSAKDKRP